jgi:hypothetical protein
MVATQGGNLMMVNIIYPHHEISRIMTAAVVSLTFRRNLLSNPLHAIEMGFGEETFILEQEQTDRLANIRANTLEEFATKIIYA